MTLAAAFDQAIAVARLKDAAFVMSVLNSNDVVTSSSTVDMDRLYAAVNEYRAAKDACDSLGVDVRALAEKMVDKEKANG